MVVVTDCLLVAGRVRRRGWRSYAESSRANTSVPNDCVRHCRPLSGAVGTTVTNAASGGQGAGAITYASSNTAVGTVNAASGAVTLGAVGSTTITATKAADSNYAAAAANYTINVTAGTQTSRLRLRVR